MPLKGNFEWEEKKDHFVLRIPLKGVAPSKVDIFATQSTVKINFTPYLVDVVLHGDIDPVRHKATVKDGTLSVKLFKVTPGIWGKFHVEEDEQGDDQDAQATLERRAVGLAAQENLEKELGEKRKDRKSQDERFSTRKQMAIDEAERTRLEDLKHDEKSQAEDALYAAFAKQEEAAAAAEAAKAKKANVLAKGRAGPTPISSAVPPKPAPIAQASKKFDDIDSDIEDDEEEKLRAITKSVDIDLNGCPDDGAAEDADDLSDDEVKYVPPPRSATNASTNDGSGGVSGKVNIDFTPRIFPTPMRSSQTAREDDWIAKNRKHLKKHGVFGKNLKGNSKDISEEDPTWLKAKGDDFYRNGDCRSAINAYSASIDADETMVASYANRSACYLRLGMDKDCSDDCTDCIALLEKQREEVVVEDPDDAVAAAALLANNSMTLKLLLRRGIVQCRLGLLAEALQDYTTGCEILKKNTLINVPGITLEQVTQDVEQLGKIVYADEKKKEADILFGQRDLLQAVALYTEVLEVIPEHVGCISNRSACKIALGDLEGCVQDCNLAVHYLQSESHKLGDNSSAGVISAMSDSSLSMLYAVVPPPDSEKRKNWLMKTVVRRGAVVAQLGNLDDAIRDYGLALSLEPMNADLQTDLQNLVNTRTKRAQLGAGGLVASAEQTPVQ
jgi:dyslexia susceptibility 1 candidate gene 1 protein